MRLQLCLSVFALVLRPVFSAVNFVFPPAFDFVTTTNFSSNIIMIEGDFKVIQWANVSNPNKARISVTMWQSIGTQYFGDPEYVIRMYTLRSTLFHII
jgi:hypothetical protein